VLSAYPECGLSKRHIGDEIMMTAAAAGLAVEIGLRSSCQSTSDQASPRS
jgi:hypothetical protein